RSTVQENDLVLIEELSHLTLNEVTGRYADGSLCPVMVEATIAQIEATNGCINALYDLQRDPSIAEALASREIPIGTARRSPGDNQGFYPFKGYAVVPRLGNARARHHRKGGLPASSCAEASRR